ncbi:hypothetical protein ED733_000234 [Metarhizium rileyi]|uniref:Uncharacterized protein n=1 Tax=Metarhizium rileyi (strain RCEF 4871) TaxID=1649241 RepID=A0A5C6GG17_METRR|nr:hypothetical protein ED733_000234 [Metarhizium rileyi]
MKASSILFLTFLAREGTAIPMTGNTLEPRQPIKGGVPVNVFKNRPNGEEITLLPGNKLGGVPIGPGHPIGGVPVDKLVPNYAEINQGHSKVREQGLGIPEPPPPDFIPNIGRGK